MDKDVLEGKWFQVRGKIQERWGRLKSEDLESIHGERQRLLDRLEELYDDGRQWLDSEIDAIVAAGDARDENDKESP